MREKGCICGVLFVPEAVQYVLTYDEICSMRNVITWKFLLSWAQEAIGLDRVRVMLTGAAPVATHVITFMRIVVGSPLLEG